MTLFVVQIGSIATQDVGQLDRRHVRVADDREGVGAQRRQELVAVRGVGPLALMLVEIALAPPRRRSASWRRRVLASACRSRLTSSGSTPSAKSWRADRARSRASFKLNADDRANAHHALAAVQLVAAAPRTWRRYLLICSSRPWHETVAVVGPASWCARPSSRSAWHFPWLSPASRAAPVATPVLDGGSQRTISDVSGTTRKRESAMGRG